MTHVSRMLSARRDWLRVLEIERTNWDGAFCESETYQGLCFGRAIHGRVIEHPDGMVAAYAVFAIHRDIIDLQNLTVHQDYLGMGYGGELIDHLKSKLNPRRRTRIVSIVHERNMNGCQFLTHHGFRAVRVIQRAYPIVDDDGYLFEFSIEE